MNFALSEEQELLQETVRSWVEKECPATLVRGVVDGDAAPVEPLWRGFVEMGLAGLPVPEPYGGAGLALLDLALVAEELGRGGVPGPFLGHALATLAIVQAGSEAQKARLLPGLATGEWLGSVAFGEADGRWAPEALATRVDDGKASGVKCFVPHGSQADVIVVAIEGGGLALLERGAAGTRSESDDGIDVTRPVETLHLEGAPVEHLEGHGAARLRDAGLVLLAADAFGVGSQLVAMSCAYAMQRQQFGQPIAQFQAIKHQLADMALAVDPTRGLWWYAAHAFDDEPEQSERTAAVAKAHITDRVMQVARDAVEVHGGIGYTWECDVQIWFKRAMFDRAFLGTPEHHRERSAQLGGW